MKIQIDTEKKIIKIEEKVNLKEFFEHLQQFFPNNEWETYSLEAPTNITNWNSPVIIKETPWIKPNDPYNPYPWITYGTDTEYTLNNGVYNVEITNDN